MTGKDLSIALELKARLSETVRLVDFMIFGSRARGDCDADSDMDVFLEVESLDRSVKRSIRNIVWATGYEYSIYISPLIFSRDEIEQSPVRSSPIVRNIFSEGIRV
ncbi:MAG: nucleotidyltransferase domain-containing protein [Nitrospirae bacterium]|nr:nucleotidyltransferase domain-containing protein [Nitrospirota bacterium]